MSDEPQEEEKKEEETPPTLEVRVQDTVDISEKTGEG